MGKRSHVLQQLQIKKKLQCVVTLVCLWNQFAYMCIEDHLDNWGCRMGIDMIQRENCHCKLAKHLGRSCKLISNARELFKRKSLLWFRPKRTVKKFRAQFMGMLVILVHTIPYTSPKLHMLWATFCLRHCSPSRACPTYILGAHVFKATTQNRNAFHYVGRRTRCKYIIGHKIW